MPSKPRARLPPPPLAGAASQVTSENKSSKIVTDQYGRIRSFPHVDGNYPGYIFIKAGHAADMEDAANEMAQLARSLLPPDRTLHTIPVDELHVSLSRTFAVRRHHIEPLVALLTDRLRATPRFTISLRGGRLYANDDNTRTFAGLRVRTGHDRARRLIAAADAAMRAFHQPPYYSEADVHVSVAWSVGPLPEPAPEWPGPEPDPEWAGGVEAVLPVAAVHAKIGARTYSFELPPP
jgi:2'-5' RNA ligase